MDNMPKHEDEGEVLTINLIDFFKIIIIYSDEYMLEREYVVPVAMTMPIIKYAN